MATSDKTIYFVFFLEQAGELRVFLLRENFILICQWKFIDFCQQKNAFPSVPSSAR